MQLLSTHPSFVDSNETLTSCREKTGKFQDFSLVSCLSSVVITRKNLPRNSTLGEFLNYRICVSCDGNWILGIGKDYSKVFAIQLRKKEPSQARA